MTAGIGEHVLGVPDLDAGTRYWGQLGFQPIAEEVITCASPGTNLADPSDFTYTKLRPGIRRRPGG